MTKTTTSVAKAREQREAHSGRKYARAWQDWCVEKGKNPGEDCLKEWDETHNGGRIRELFGSKADVYEVGLTTLYRRFMYNYCTVRVVPGDKGKAIRLSGIRKTSGGLRFLGMSSQDEIIEMCESMKAHVIADARRARFLGLPMREIRRLVDEALERVEETEGMADAAD